MAFKRLTNNPDAAATAVAAQNAVTNSKSPFEPGRTAQIEYHSQGMTGTPVIKCQGSDDGGTTWVDLFTLTTAEALAAITIKEVQLMGQTRMNLTEAGTGGTYTAYQRAPSI